MNIIKTIQNAFVSAKNKGWDKIYVAVDLHGTVCESNYNNEEGLKFYPLAKETLQELTKFKYIVLILYTCSYKTETDKLVKYFKTLNIDFKYVNFNPEAEDTKYGTYKDKAYFNVLIDDKAGFEPSDWNDIYNEIKKFPEQL